MNEERGEHINIWCQINVQCKQEMVLIIWLTGNTKQIKKGLKIRKIDLTGQRFGRLVVLRQGKSHIYPSGKTRVKWICQCDCGNIIETKGNGLKSGHTKSCGCLNQEKRSQRRIYDLTGKKFGKLTALKRVGTKRFTSKTCAPIWLCRCDCGNYCQVYSKYLICGDTKSCGCLISYGEEQICRFFAEHKARIKREYSFDDLLSSAGNPLKFDFVLFDNDDNPIIAIEYQGQQHIIDFGEFGKQQREETDDKKFSYCVEHLIGLERIWYFENIEERLNDIYNLYLKVNPVPIEYDLAGETTIPQGSRY